MQPTIKLNEQDIHAAIKILRAKNMVGISSLLLSDIDPASLPQEFNRNILRQTTEQLGRFTREVIRTIPNTDSYLSKSFKEAKMLDAVTLLDLIQRIGYEEKGDIYEEFLGLLVDVLDEVFYATKNRKNIHFAKYKLFFRFIAEELHNDVSGNGERNMEVIKGELFLKLKTKSSNIKMLQK